MTEKHDRAGGVRRLNVLPAPPTRPQAAHKGTFGSVLVIAGSEGMSGAACLAGTAALHGGAGLVTVATPRVVLPLVAAGNPCYMTLPLAAQSGGIAATATVQVEQALARYTAVAVGPGLGQSAGTQSFVQHLHKTSPLPMVLDADALNAFARVPDQLANRSTEAARVLTPHPGELSRLTRRSVAAIQSDREASATEFAREHGVILLLKGPNTVITDGSRLAVNTTGNHALAKGGSGDVLTGLLGALLAQGMEAFDAALLAAHLHGLAGDLMAARHTAAYATASELLCCLDDAWKALAT